MCTLYPTPPAKCMAPFLLTTLISGSRQRAAACGIQQHMMVLCCGKVNQNGQSDPLSQLRLAKMVPGAILCTWLSTHTVSSLQISREGVLCEKVAL